MKRIRLINLILIMFCCCNMLAQNITVTGQVVDVTSEPIIGASVVVKGTTNGTITDFDGNFTLSVQKGETLHISYIGYVAQDVKVMGNQPVKVVMAEDTETLDEVVVVGTSMKKSDLTGAFWGAKSACEPVHILWNPVTDGVKIANTTACDMEGLTAEVKVYNLDGKSVEAYTKSAIVNSPSNSTVQCFTIDFNKERKNLSLNKPTFASSTTYGQPSDATDGKKDTRWAAAKAENEWLYVDLGSVQPVGGVRLDWEASFGKGYKIQVSDDTETWKEVYKTDEGRGGIDEITFPEVDARYVRMFGTELGWWFGYSLWSFDVLGGTQPSEGLSDVHFIRLTLKDKSGKIVSENNYWRGNDRLDFTALNTLPKAELKTSSKLIRKNGEAEIQAAITLPKSAKGVAFAVHVQAVRASDGERILPALMNDNYFTLMPGETKNLSITFDENLLQGDKYKLVVTPYNNK